jgi:hypothetical protein
MSESVAAPVASNASTIQTTVSGRGAARGNTNSGRSNRTGRSNRSNNRGNRTNNNTHLSKGNFKGSTVDMNGHVFECYEERGDRTQFPRTLDALGEYAAKNLKYPEDLKSMFGETMSAPTLIEVPNLLLLPSRRDELIWEAAIKTFSRRSETLQSNLTTLYAVIWGQCSEAMRTKIRALDDFPTQNPINNCIWLLREIKGVTHQFDTKRNVFLSLLDARIVYYTCKQGPNQSNADYLEIFSANVEVLEYYKASVGESYLLIDDVNGTRTVAQRTALARNATIAMSFLRGADSRRYATLWSDLANQQTRGNDQYPTDLTLAYGMLVNYHSPTPNRQQHPIASSNATTTSISNVPTDIGHHTFVQAARGSTTTSQSGLTAGTD